MCATLFTPYYVIEQAVCQVELDNRSRMQYTGYRECLMRLLVSLCVLIAACDCGGYDLRKSLSVHCGEACWTGFKQNRGVGVCHDGYVACADDGTETCEGQRLPSEEETCNGLDDTCDGTLARFENDFDKDGFMVCEGDCNDRDPTTHPGAVEVCDGADNDCDKIVDNNLPVSFCYDKKPPESVAHGDCHPGVTACVDGKLVCSGEKGPTRETCDLMDNDCNGVVDDGFSALMRDVVVILDISGSMDKHIPNIERALDEIYRAGGMENARLALLYIAPTDRTKLFTLVTNFTDPASFMHYINNTFADSRGDEEVWDCLRAIATPEYLFSDELDPNVTQLSWGTGPRTAVVFNDEEQVDNIGTENDAATALVKQNIRTIVFGIENSDSYYQIVNDTAGAWFDMTSLRQNLGSVFNNYCGSP